MQNSAGVKPVGQAAIMALDHINQIIWPQLYSPVKSPHDNKTITYLDGLIPQHGSKKEHEKEERRT
jgi:hypothetical protein